MVHQVHTQELGKKVHQPEKWNPYRDRFKINEELNTMGIKRVGQPVNPYVDAFEKALNKKIVRQRVSDDELKDNVLVQNYKDKKLNFTARRDLAGFIDGCVMRVTGEAREIMRKNAYEASKVKIPRFKPDLKPYQS